MDTEVSASTNPSYVVEQDSSSMNKVERTTALSLSAVFAVRMLGLFMILPVFAVLGAELEFATPFLIGFAIGAYGLSQALLQIPFGRLSDRLGRKPVIVSGLILFAVGGVIAALSDSIYGVIAGRLLQGAGAIAAAVMALAADLSRDEQRSKVMASIGMSIGGAFALAMMIGPMFADWWGLSGLFWASSLLALVAISIILWATPSPTHRYVQRDAIAGKGDFKHILKHTQLWRLNTGIFALHFLLTAFFVTFPTQLVPYGISLTSSGWLYLGVMIGAVILMIPLIIWAEKKWQHRNALLVAMGLIALLLPLLGSYNGGLVGLIMAMILFFTGFNVMEALFPSLISRLAPASAKGAALGVYSTSQFLGAAVGGPVAGFILQVSDATTVYYCISAIAVTWMVFALGMKSPPRLTSYTLTLHHIDDQSLYAELLADIQAIQGVAEAVALPEAGAVYLKVDKQEFDEKALQALKLKTLSE